MTEEQSNLWDNIQDYEIDNPESDFTFTDRLARENGWKIGYSLRAIDEYKRFMFLACVSGHSVTPSDPVDQVWHLHLLYTQSYWVEFCKHILGKEIHHGPTKGGTEEGDRYRDLYSKTINSYKIFFIENPPKDIWQPANIRFSEINFKRVNMHRNWVLKKIL